MSRCISGLTVSGTGSVRAGTSSGRGRLGVGVGHGEDNNGSAGQRQRLHNSSGYLERSLHDGEGNGCRGARSTPIGVKAVCGHAVGCLAASPLLALAGPPRHRARAVVGAQADHDDQAVRRHVARQLRLLARRSPRRGSREGLHRGRSDRRGAGDSHQRKGLGRPADQAGLPRLPADRRIPLGRRDVGQPQDPHARQRRAAARPRTAWATPARTSTVRG